MPESFDNSTKDFRDLLIRSETLAAQNNHREILNPHLAFGVLTDTEVSNFLYGMNFRVFDVRAKLTQHLPPQNYDPSSEDPILSDDAKLVIEDAVRQRVQTGSSVLRPQHLLLALVNQDQELMSDLLDHPTQTLETLTAAAVVEIARLDELVILESRLEARIHSVYNQLIIEAQALRDDNNIPIDERVKLLDDFVRRSRTLRTRYSQNPNTPDAPVQP